MQDEYENIRRVLKQFFIKWSIPPSRVIKDYNCFLSRSGVYIIYALGTDKHSEICLHLCASHRMTNSFIVTIKKNGETENIVGYAPCYSYDSKIKGDKERAEEEYFTYNGMVAATYKLLGLAENITNTGVNNNIIKKYKELTYFDESHYLHPDYEAKFKRNGIEFNSVSHYYNYWRERTRNRHELAETILKEPQNYAHFLPAPPQSSERGVRNANWFKQRLRILQAGCLSKFDQNEALKNELLKDHKKLLVFKSDNNFWGIGTKREFKKRSWRGDNILGYLMSQVCYDMYCLNRHKKG